MVTLEAGSGRCEKVTDVELDWPSRKRVGREGGPTRISPPESAFPDTPLIEAAIKGDDAAFAALVQRHKRKVFAIAAGFARDDHELDDLCQEAFVKVYQNLKKFRGQAPFEHWLSRITVRVCYDALRKRRREIPLESVESSLSDPTAENGFSAGQAREMIEWAFRKLCPDERLVITLLELEERSVLEVAALTGWSEAKVKVRAFRARKALRKVLEVNDA